MSNETLFFVFGIALAVSAVGFSLVGLRNESFPGRAFPLVVLWFAILVGCATTFAVMHSREEENFQGRGSAPSRQGNRIRGERRPA